MNDMELSERSAVAMQAEMTERHRAAIQAEYERTKAKMEAYREEREAPLNAALDACLKAVSGLSVAQAQTVFERARDEIAKRVVVPPQGA